MKKNLKKRPLTTKDLESKKSLMIWRIDLQNMVNKKLGKKNISHEEALKKIDKLLKSRNSNDFNDFSDSCTTTDFESSCSSCLS
jgi:hypothetical protein